MRRWRGIARCIMPRARSRPRPVGLLLSQPSHLFFDCLSFVRLRFALSVRVAHSEAAARAYAPDGCGARRAREHFEALCAVQDAILPAAAPAASMQTPEAGASLPPSSAEAPPTEEAEPIEILCEDMFKENAQGVDPGSEQRLERQLSDQPQGFSDAANGADRKRRRLLRLDWARTTRARRC